MDVSKLTPAPWKISMGSWGNGGCYPYVSSINHEMSIDGATDCEFIALARNAFDVMMRRGWGVVKLSGGWAPALPTQEDLVDLRVQRWSNPLTALVEADRWYKENVEKS